MRHSWLGLIELFVVLMFVIGWGVLELVALRVDGRKAQSAGDAASESESGHARDAGHAEGQ
jgi:hypothetical protein